MDKINRMFHKSTENTTSISYTETCHLLRLYAANLLNSETILEAGDDLKISQTRMQRITRTWELEQQHGGVWLNWKRLKTL